MTQKDYVKFNQLFLYFSSCSVFYTTEYKRWRDAGNNHGDTPSDKLKLLGDDLDAAGKAVREFVKQFVVKPDIGELISAEEILNVQPMNRP